MSPLSHGRMLAGRVAGVNPDCETLTDKRLGARDPVVSFGGSPEAAVRIL